jgi:hypothetical protein
MTDTTAVDFQPLENKSGSLFSKKDLDTSMVRSHNYKKNDSTHYTQLCY